MSPEKQRIAIAEACGWERREDLDFTVYGSSLKVQCFAKDGYVRHLNGLHNIPDFLNDLNAMHEAEKTLPPDLWKEYMDWVDDDREFEFLTATAAQRAEAFLRTIGKWEES